MAISERTRIIACLVVCALLAYAAVLFAGATFVGRDHLTHTIPAKQFIAETLRDGRIPEWWPAVDLGVPFLANPDHSALYPPVWLVALLPMPFGADVVLVFHALLAGLGTAALARRLGADTQGALVGGAAFMLGGLVTSTVVTGGPLLTLAWAPWIAWAADRVACATARRARVRGALLLAALAGVQLLAGHPSMVITGAFLAFGVGLCRARLRVATLAAIASAYVGALMLAAVLIVPALLLAAESSRTGGLDHEVATTWSMHPLRLVEWIWPGFLGDPNQASEHLARAVADTAGGRMAPGWALSLYISLPIVVLTVLACARDRALRWLAVCAAVFVLLALGRYTPLYELYRTVFLPERLVRYPEKHIAGAILITCALAGVGWTSLARNLPARRGAIALAATLLGFGVLLFVLPVLLPGSHEGIDVEAARAYANRHGLTALGVTALLAAAFAIARRLDARSAKHVRSLGVIVLVVHFLVLAWQLLPTFDRAIVKRPPQIVDGVPSTGTPRLARPLEHVVRPGDSLAGQARTLYEGAAPNGATRFGFAYLVGYDQAHSGRFRAWRPMLSAARDRINDLFAVDYVIVRAENVVGAALATDAPFGPYALVRNEGKRPRAFVTTRWRWLVDDDQLITIVLENPHLAITHFVGSGEDATGTDDLQPCALTSPQPEVVDVVCDTPRAGYAVLLDAWSPGWSATVDGKPARIERAEGIARGVRIDAGHHAISFRYATPGLCAGATISIFAWLTLIAIYFRIRSD